MGGLPGRVIGLLSKWSRQAPSKTLDPVTSWSAVIAHRQDCFKAIKVRVHGLNKYLLQHRVSYVCCYFCVYASVLCFGSRPVCVLVCMLHCFCRCRVRQRDGLRALDLVTSWPGLGGRSSPVYQCFYRPSCASQYRTIVGGYSWLGCPPKNDQSSFTLEPPKPNEENTLESAILISKR